MHDASHLETFGCNVVLGEGVDHDDLGRVDAEVLAADLVATGTACARPPGRRS